MSDNGKVVHIGEAIDCSFAYSPEQLLESVLKEIRNGDISPDKILIIMLDEDEAEGTYDVFCRMAQLKHSECVALMQYANHMLLDTMYTGEV